MAFSPPGASKSLASSLVKITCKASGWLKKTIGPNLWLSLTVKQSPYCRLQARINENGLVTHWSICHTLGAFGPSGSAISVSYTSCDLGASEWVVHTEITPAITERRAKEFRLPKGYAELEEPVPEGTVGSSTMRKKHNP